MAKKKKKSRKKLMLKPSRVKKSARALRLRAMDQSSDDDEPRTYVSREEMLREYNGVAPESIAEDWG